MFRDIPGCSGMFRNVPCSRFYRRPFLTYITWCDCTIAQLTLSLAHVISQLLNYIYPWIYTWPSLFVSPPIIAPHLRVDLDGITFGRAKIALRRFLQYFWCDQKKLGRCDHWFHAPCSRRNSDAVWTFVSLRQGLRQWNDWGGRLVGLGWW